MDPEGDDAVADENVVNEQPRSETTVNPKVQRAMKNLKPSFNPEAVKILAKAKGGNKLLPISESSAIALSVCMELSEPRTFQEAWNHPDPEQCMKLNEAIRKEFADMN